MEININNNGFQLTDEISISNMMYIDYSNYQILFKLLQYAKNVTHIKINISKFDNINYLPPNLQYLNTQYFNNNLNYLPNSLKELAYFGYNINHINNRDKLPIATTIINFTFHTDIKKILNMPLYLTHLLIYYYGNKSTYERNLYNFSKELSSYTNFYISYSYLEPFKLIQSSLI